LTDPEPEDEDEPEEETDNEPEDDTLFTTSMPQTPVPKTTLEYINPISTTTLGRVDPVSTSSPAIAEHLKNASGSNFIGPISTSSPPISEDLTSESTDTDPISTSSPPISDDLTNSSESIDTDSISNSSVPISEDLENSVEKVEKAVEKAEKAEEKAEGSNAGNDVEEAEDETNLNNTTTKTAFSKRKKRKKRKKKSKHGGAADYIYPLASRANKPNDESDLNLPELTTTSMEVFFPGEHLSEEDTSEWHDDDEQTYIIPKKDEGANVGVPTKAKRLVIIPLSRDEPYDTKFQGTDPEPKASKRLAHEIEGEILNIIDSYDNSTTTFSLDINATTPPRTLPVAGTTTIRKGKRSRWCCGIDV
jgi:hypothetical protein